MRIRTTLALCLTFAPSGPPCGAAQPLKLHLGNPHYLLFRGKPTVLVTSGEHYGAVLNLDFDFLRYLDALRAAGLNLTRTFSGVYCEARGSFGITGNPLAPAPGRLICPWARSAMAGYANGGNKFDLASWDEAYFARLEDFVAQAGRRGIVVELVLFCPFYKDEMWNLSPMKAANNVNGIGRVERTGVYTLRHERLLAVQEAVVRKIVGELAGFDNLYYEVCNEPYFGGVTPAWQDRIIATIVEAEASLPFKHLIAQNIANRTKKIRDPNPAISIFNFHYAAPPVCVAENDRLGRVIADDETGFRGPGDLAYRSEGWDFIIAGGAIYSNLDYSFTPDHEDGTATPKAPGGGGPTLRRQLGILKGFIHGLDFVRMRPRNGVIEGGIPPGGTARCLARPGEAYAIYVKGGTRANLILRLPAGMYGAEWVSTKTGDVEKAETFRHEGGPRRLASPPYEEDIALRIARVRRAR